MIVNTVVTTGVADLLSINYIKNNKIVYNKINISDNNSFFCMDSLSIIIIIHNIFNFINLDYDLLFTSHDLHYN